MANSLCIILTLISFSGFKYPGNFSALKTFSYKSLNARILSNNDSQTDSVSSISIYSLFCDSKKNPIGISPSDVRFSWKMNSKKRNQIQSAWQIVVASSANNLKIGHYLWNSGKVLSEDNILIPYKGSSLESAHNYFWRVKIWDGNHRPSKWSSLSEFTTGLSSQKDWDNAKWIGYETLPDSHKIAPGVPNYYKNLGNKGRRKPVIPLFRKIFTIKKKISSALLFISGIGQYDASINGRKVGHNFLTPGWTYYPETCLYNTYDVTKYLRNGRNAIGVIVGNGFYNINKERYKKFIIAMGMPEMICELRITYTDGKTQIVSSNSSWKTSPSPITFTSIYGGEDYDARLEQKSWNTPDFDDHSWKKAMVVPAPGGKLDPETEYPVKIMKIMKPVKITEPVRGRYVYDFGQNASGIVELKVKGHAGQKIRLTPGEILNTRNMVDQKASGRPYYWTYTLKGNGVETWKPRFTYYGFRYVQVRGAVPDTSADVLDKPQIITLKFLHTRNSAPTVGTFQCSDTLFNRIFSLINWAIKSNIQSIITDCPHREKLGWLEQDYLMGSSIHYNFDIYHLLRRTEYNIMDAQTKTGLVPDIAPEYVVFNNGFRDSPEWGSASVILPWQIYKWYGDKKVMEKAWPTMIKYVDYLQNKARDHILSYGLGDWFDLGPKPPGEAQLTPKGITATGIYYYDLKLLSSMGYLLGKDKEAKELFKRAETVKKAFNKKYFNPRTATYATGSQTSMAIPLVVGLVPPGYHEKVLKNLVTAIKNNRYALTSGDIGFHFLVRALQENHASNILYKMNNRSDVPGYGYQLKMGATSLTESWAALNTLSNNHLMLGHLMEWFYNGLAGIKQSGGSSAYSNIVIKPNFVGTIKWVKAEFNSPKGKIKSDWHVYSHFTKLNVRIPVNTNAEIVLPVSNVKDIAESGLPISKHKNIEVSSIKKHSVTLKIGSGSYDFQFKK